VGGDLNVLIRKHFAIPTNYLAVFITNCAAALSPTF